jgi:lipoprotein-releasing system permease protein
MRFSLYIARRYLSSRRHSRFLNRVSLIAVIGIVLGVTVLDLTLAIMNGFHAELRRTFVDNMPMVTVVTSEPEGFPRLGAVMDSIGALPGVTGVAPFVRQEAIVTVRSRGGQGLNRAAVVWGIDPDLQETVTPLQRHLLPRGLAVAGLRERGGTPGIVLGAELATSLYAGLGDTVLVTSPSGGFDLENLRAETRPFVLCGLLDSGMYEFDSRFAYVPIDAARDFFGYSSEGASGIGVKLSDMMAAPRIAHAIEQRLGPFRYHATDWIALNQNLFKWIRIEKVVMFLLLALIVLVAAFNIIGILTMMVGERSREIGILLAMGARPRQVQGVFMVEGIALGAAGTAIGSLLGYLGYLYLDRIGVRLPGDVYFLDRVPVVAQAGDFLAVAGAALAITILATLAPSHEAARLKPMEIIRWT